jgi:hypothetical protein
VPDHGARGTPHWVREYQSSAASESPANDGITLPVPPAAARGKVGIRERVATVLAQS